VPPPPSALPKPLDCPPLRPPKGDADPVEDPLPPKLSLGASAGFAAAPKPPKGEPDDDPPPKTLFPDPPRAPKGDAVEDASLANPELANAEADVCLGFSSVFSVSLLSKGFAGPAPALVGREPCDR
jgi:hypothetical protein